MFVVCLLVAVDNFEKLNIVGSLQSDQSSHNRQFVDYALFS